VAVAPSGCIGLGESERRGVDQYPHRGRALLGSRRHREQQVVLVESEFLDVRLDLGDDLAAQLEAPVFLILGVGLDEEPAALRVEPRRQLDDHSAHGQDAGTEVDVAWAQLGQLTPAEPAFDVCLGE
jgi:hypothetical protein